MDLDPTATDTGTLDPAVTAPPDPAPAPAPSPAPDVTPAPAPAPAPDFYESHYEQVAGARKALMASSMNAAVETKPEQESRIVVLADKLGLSANVVRQNYDQLSRSVALRNVDYSRLLLHHPEVSQWLVDPANASIARDDLPVLQTIDNSVKALAGKPYDPNGILPDGYMFKKDGTIRGPLNIDGREPVIYKSLDTLRAKFERDDAQQRVDAFQAQAAADQLSKPGEWWRPSSWVPASVAAGAESSISSTLSALSRATGGGESDSLLGLSVPDMAAGGQRLLAGSQRLAPGLSGDVGRAAGQLLGDAPLYLLGGEVGGIADLGASMRTIAAGAKVASVAPRSEYLLDAFKTAATYSPIAARSGINTGSERGASYGVTDFILNSAVPGAFGSRFGVAKALLPGQETAAAAGGWLGTAGRVMAHVGAQGGIQATTELANAIHEYASGDAEALKSDTLVPRLAQAGAMGSVLAGAFHIPGAIGEQVHRQQIAAHAALDHADRLGQTVELIQAAKVANYSPERFAALMKQAVPDEARTTYFQGEDWEGVAKEAGMNPEDFAAAMHVEEQYRLAKQTGQSMAVPTAELLQHAAGLEKPEAITSVLMNARKVPEGTNATESVHFFKEKPEEIDAMVKALKEDVTEQAKAVTETDPIYTDFLGKAVDAGRPVDESKRDARLMAAFFNIRAERWNEGAEARGATKIDALAEYQRYRLRVQTEDTSATGIEPLDMMLDRIRGGNIPKEQVGPLAKIAAKGITPETIDRAHEEGLINERTPEALRSALELENDLQAPEPIREALTGLQTHLKSKGIDIAKSNAEIKALLAGDELPPVQSYEQRLEVPSAHLRHEYLLKQWKKAHGDRSPTPTDKDWQKLVRQADMVDAAQGRRYFQPGDSGGARGSISYNAERHFLITLTGKANLSTVLHESGHFFLEVMGDYAEREGAPEEFKSDYGKMLKFLGVEKRADITTEHHEKWARAVEQYLMEGHAPSPELRPVFQRFALWLGHLYSKVKALVTLTPEVRGVMDRMLASDKAIEEARKDLGASTIFKDREASGMTEKEWNAYLKDIQTERERSYANVFNSAMKTLRRENTKAYRRERADALQEAADVVNARPVHVAEDLFVHGRGPDGKDLESKPKLDREEIEREYGKGTIHKLPRGITDDGGMSLQMAADTIDRMTNGVGFKSGEELWTALANLPDRKAEIRKLAEGIMQARHPELMPEEMLGKAMEAIHSNSSHADVLGRESAALAIKAGQRKIPQDQIKRIAEGIINETNMRDVDPRLHMQTQRKASREAAAALLDKSPDYTAAFLAKQREELSHALVRASMEAKEVIDKTGELMKTAKREKTREMLGKAGGTGWVVTDAEGMATSFINNQEGGTAQAAADFAKNTGGTASEFPGYLTAMDRLRDKWEDRGERFSMDYGEVSAFYDTARVIMHQAREAFTLIQDDKRLSLENEVATAVRTENEVRKKPLIEERTLGPKDKAGRSLAQFDAFMRKLSFVAREMDGEKDGGWHWEQLVRPLNKAGDNEQARSLANTEAVSGLLKTWGKGGVYKKEFIPAIGKRLTLEGRIMVALNVGSTRNLERLMTGETWTREQVKAITDTLDAKDWALVKGIWEHINSFWPEIRDTKARLDGVAPEKRDSLLVDTPHGTIEGQYFPIVYDPHLSARALDLSLEQKRQASSGRVNAGMTEKAVESTGLRLLLDWRAVTGHMSSVAHYLSHAEAISNLNKLLNNKQLTDNMIQRFGMETFKVIRDTVQDVAKGTEGPKNVAERALRFLRQRSGMAVMGFNVMSAATQVFGMTQAMERVGAGNYLRAQQRILASAMDAENFSKVAMDKSLFMRNRASTQNLETLETTGVGPLSGAPSWARSHAYTLMHKAQWLVDLPTWHAAYETALKDHPADDAKCVALADQAVIDTQGSGMLKDLSKVQRMNEMTKMLMQFGSFFNSTYNLGRNRVAATDFKDPASVLRLGQAFMLLVSLPAVAMSAFQEAARPSKDDDGSAGYWAKRLAKDHLSYLLNTIVLGRELSGSIQGFDYSGPAGMRSISALSGLTKQVFQGQADKGLAHAAIMAGGTLWGLPAVQAERVIKGILYDSEHGTADPRPVLFGPPH